MTKYPVLRKKSPLGVWIRRDVMGKIQNGFAVCRIGRVSKSFL